MGNENNHLEELRISVGYLLIEIEEMLEDKGVAGTKLTLVARNPAQPGMYIVIGNDYDPASVSKLIMAQGDMVEGESVLSMDDEPVHAWFELSYAQYLTVPRSVLQSMPVGWQRRFVQCLEELDETIDWRPQEFNQQYRVSLWEWGEVWDEEEGRYVEKWIRELDDPLMDYERGRRRISHKSAGEEEE